MTRVQITLKAPVLTRLHQTKQAWSRRSRGERNRRQFCVHVRAGVEIIMSSYAKNEKRGTMFSFKYLFVKVRIDWSGMVDKIFDWSFLVVLMEFFVHFLDWCGAQKAGRKEMCKIQQILSHCARLHAFLDFSGPIPIFVNMIHVLEGIGLQPHHISNVWLGFTAYQPS